MTIDVSLSLDTTHSVLGWPNPTDITHPNGAGAAVFASLVREKIGGALAHFSDVEDASIGVLMSDPNAITSEPPLAIVVESHTIISDSTLREILRLSWNFSHVPTLITVEPTILRVWSCCEPPDPAREIQEYLVHDLCADDFESGHVAALENTATRALHWINLISGEFFAQNSARFNRDGRADQILLRNLRHIRSKLADEGLKNDDVCHDLLARIIFVQFLFDRKDKDGKAALTPEKLTRLYKQGVLRNKYDSFSQLLKSYDDTYLMFDWLNTKFNGDLFPGKGDTKKDRDQGWSKEKSIVKSKHLFLLADFVCGELDMPSGQGYLWPQYAFDVIPLEFISSIYETFVTERAAEDGIFYTPPYLVDFVLDRVLPWNGKEWDLKVLDPSCGSGIFLVKSFQRLIHRWKNSNPDEPVRAELLRRLLENNIIGVDKDPHAVRVACFSLYLAMCDEIEPRHYWTQVTFPSMRGKRLICSDFFKEDQDNFNTENDENSYDLIVGNAPWGDGVITEEAKCWAASEKHNWTVPNNDIGGLFLAKSAHLVSKRGKVALIQSANSLLFNLSPTASKFRKELFSTYRVEEIYNLSALRFKVFKRKSHTTKTSVSPACVFILNSEKPELDDKIRYISPKQLKPLVDEFTIVVEQQDIRTLLVQEAVSDGTIWCSLMWGRPRDRQLLKKLQSYPSLASLSGEHQIVSRQGIKYGDRKKPAPELKNWQIFNDTMFPDGDILYLETEKLPVLGDIHIETRASTSLDAFAWPQMIIKQSWKKRTGRFHARLPNSKNRKGILCNESYYSVHAELPLLEAACLSLNSVVASYFLMLTSGRFLFIPKPSKQELLNVPIPTPDSASLEGINNYIDLDARVFDCFELNDSDRVLIEDMVEYTMADFSGNGASAGYASTVDSKETHLTEYCRYFSRVLKAGFGEEKVVNSTIFKTGTDALPYRLIAFELNEGNAKPVHITDIQSSDLLNEFERLNSNLQNQHDGIFKNQVTRIYEVVEGNPTIFIIKPDKKRYWTRSIALQDGDDVALDIFRWVQTQSLEEVSI